MNWLPISLFMFSISLPDVFARTSGTCRAFDAKDRLISYAQEAVTCQDTFKARIRIKVFVFESYFHLRSQLVALSYGEFMDGLDKILHHGKELKEGLNQEILNFESEVIFGISS